MTPGYRILADNHDITHRIRDRLIKLKVSDRAGMSSDTAEIELDDRGVIAMPRKGAKLDVSIGYMEQGLVRMGAYVVDEIELSGPPDRMLIRAKAADMRQQLKARRTRSWHDTTIGAMVATIAAKHGLTPRVGEFLAPISIPHMDQAEEY